MLKHFVQYLHYGIPLYGTSIQEVPKRDVGVVDIPNGCFGFRFFDRTVIVIDGETLTGNGKNVSGWYYKDQKMTLEQMRDTYGNNNNYCILISRMEDNGYDAVVKTKFLVSSYLSKEMIPFCNS